MGMSWRWSAGVRGVGSVARVPRTGLIAAGVCAALASLAPLGCKPAPAPAFGSGLSRVPANAQVSRLEVAMAARLNRDRKAHGLPALRLDERLSEIARHHSADM